MASAVGDWFQYGWVSCLGAAVFRTQIVYQTDGDRRRLSSLVIASLPKDTGVGLRRHGGLDTEGAAENRHLRHAVWRGRRRDGLERCGPRRDLQKCHVGPDDVGLAGKGSGFEA